MVNILFDIATVPLSLAFTSTVLSFMLIMLGLKYMNMKALKSGVNLALLHTVLLTTTTTAMLYYLTIRDFQVAYVAMYTDRSLPLIYTISALWAGPSGSLLFWSWILSIFIAVFILVEKKDVLTFYAVGFMVLVNILLTGFLTLASNPFVRLDFTPPDGQGLNPLLQDFGMVLHPPTLFIGYAALTIPYSLAMAGLMYGNEVWLLRARKWTLIGWFSLTLGIILGAAWSYVVLGWGGYWAWDPVENASLIPWLTSTAFIHSVMVQESRRGMRFWNILLAIFTFEAVMFAAFLTRSGVLASIHAFALTGTNLVFGWYLVGLLVLSLALVVWRYELLVSEDVYGSLLGRETSFLLNNLLLIVVAITVFWGTIYPLLIKATTGASIGVGPGFYEMVFKPLFVGAVALMGFCVTLKWRHTELKAVLRKSIIPIVVGVLSIVLMFTLGYSNLLVVASSFTAGFTISSHIIDFTEDLKHTSTGNGIRLLKPLRLILAKRRRYGGYIIHIGVALILVGYIASSTYTLLQPISLKIGETVNVNNYDLTLRGVEVVNDGVKAETIAKVEVKDPTGSSTLLKPSLQYYAKSDTIVGKVSIWSRFDGDVYLIPQAISKNSAKLSVKFIPLVNLIWFGGFIPLTIGFIITLTPKSLAKKIIGV